MFETVPTLAAPEPRFTSKVLVLHHSSPVVMNTLSLSPCTFQCFCSEKTHRVCGQSWRDRNLERWTLNARVRGLFRTQKVTGSLWKALDHSGCM